MTCSAHRVSSCAELILVCYLLVVRFLQLDQELDEIHLMNDDVGIRMHDGRAEVNKTHDYEETMSTFPKRLRKKLSCGFIGYRQINARGASYRFIFHFHPP